MILKTMASAPLVEAPELQTITSQTTPVKSKAELITEPAEETVGLPTSPWGSAPRTSPWGSVPSATSPWGSPAQNASTPPASFWGSKNTVNAATLSSKKLPNSLADIMSEELAVKLTVDEEQQLHRRIAVEEDNDDDPDLRMALELSKKEAEVAKPEDSDLLMAELLQLEFDKEYDAHLARQEQHVNQNSKVTLSYRKYSHVHPVERDTEREMYDDEEVPEEKIKEPNLKFTGAIPGKGKSKHDIETNNKRNADRVMNFPPEFDTGDGDAIAMRLSNAVYNDLKVHSHKEQKISQKVRDKVDKSTAVMALDPRTRLMLYKLVNSGGVSEVHGTISTGKESVVIYAKGGSMKDRAVPPECAIKVFKTSLNEFKRREEYMRGDHRLPSQGYKKHNPRKIIRLWAEKEMHNLNRLQKVGIHCPEVVSLRKHVLVMSFIGNDQKAAPKLKDAPLSSSQMESAHAQTIEMMKTMYKSAGIVHADLSEYNMLWHASHVWFIDVSQSVELTHPNALEFLYRDCCNVSAFFKRQGLPSAISPEDLFNRITEMTLEGEGRQFAQQVVDVQQSEEFVRKTHGPAAKHQQLVDKEMAFDYFFEKAKKQRKKEQKEKHLRELEETDSEDDEDESDEDEI